MVDSPGSPDTAAASDPLPAPPVLRLVRGNPSPEELAALVTVLASVSGGAGEEGESRTAQPHWSRRAPLLRRPIFAGPGAWRASGLPS